MHRDNSQRREHAHGHDHAHEHHHGHHHHHVHDRDHVHDHDHVHGHTHAPDSVKALVGVIILTTTIFAAEVIGGFLSGSLSLLADAAHMLSDSAGLIMALVAAIIGRREANNKATFGYKRVEVLTAAINAAAVGAIGLWIIVEAVMKLFRRIEGQPIDTGLMLIVALIGLVANGASALILARGSHDSLNMRGAYLHVLSDLAGSVAVIIAGLIIRYTGFHYADAIASIIIAIIILPRTKKLLDDAVGVLLEHAPAGIDVDEVQRTVLAIDGVISVHDLHVWSLDGAKALVSCHLVVNADAGGSPECVLKNHVNQCAVLDEAERRLGELGISHTTIQIEGAQHLGHERDANDCGATAASASSKH